MPCSGQLASSRSFARGALSGALLSLGAAWWLRCLLRCDLNRQLPASPSRVCRQMTARANSATPRANTMPATSPFPALGAMSHRRYVGGVKTRGPGTCATQARKMATKLKARKSLIMRAHGFGGVCGRNMERKDRKMERVRRVMAAMAVALQCVRDSHIIYIYSLRKRTLLMSPRRLEPGTGTFPEQPRGRRRRGSELRRRRAEAMTGTWGCHSAAL